MPRADPAASHDVAALLGALVAADREYAGTIASFDVDASVRQVVAGVPELAGVDAAFVGRASGAASGSFALGHLTRCRTRSLDQLVIRPGTGMAGPVLGSRRPLWVSDYRESPRITHDYDAAVATEGLSGMVAVPIGSADRSHGVLYGACRRAVQFGDTSVAAMQVAAGRIAAAVTVAEQAALLREVAVHEERRRLALTLHDTVGALLFAIGTGTRTLGDETEISAEVQARLARIETQARHAAEELRSTLNSLAAPPDDLAFAVALQADCTAFQQRCGVRATLVLAEPHPVLDRTRTRVVLGVVREALLNVEKHARAGAVVVSARTVGDGVEVAIADDGVGFVRPVAPAAAVAAPPAAASGATAGLGLRSCRDRIGQLGGTFSARENDDGGVTVRFVVP